MWSGGVVRSGGVVAVAIELPWWWEVVESMGERFEIRIVDSVMMVFGWM